MKKLAVFALIFSSLFSTPLLAEEACEGFGPQTPRDIAVTDGENKRIFSFAPEASEMNLCNIHFHKNAEHKAPGYSVSGGEGDFGGWKCNETSELTEEELAATKSSACENVKPGDTIEVHWVHSSCDIEPGEGLGSCLSDSCPNPQLRVEAQTFLLVNDSNAADFSDFAYAGTEDGYHQAKELPDGTDAVKFLGSTTGPSYTEAKCSPLQVSWSVRPACMKLDINTLHSWCEDNRFNEKAAHGVRQIVTNTDLLAPIE